MKLMRVIGIVGMPGSGKSEAADIARSLGIPIVVMGDIIRKAVVDSDLQNNPGALRSMMIELRKKHGKDVVAERCLPLIKSYRSHDVVVVDGLRSLDEVEVFRREFPDFIIVAVHSSPRTRYCRIQERQRKDDPDSWEEFCKRDKLELRVGIGNVISLADVIISNENTRSEFRENMKRIIAKGATSHQNSN
jgi:dephospho-CoA kinase